MMICYIRNAKRRTVGVGIGISGRCHRRWMQRHCCNLHNESHVKNNHHWRLLGTSTLFDSSSKSLPSDMKFGALMFGFALTAMAAITEMTTVMNDGDKHHDSIHVASLNSNASSMQPLALSPNSHSPNFVSANGDEDDNRKDDNDDDVKEVDFVIVGYGNAGRSAHETLRKECPSASIAIIDPLTAPNAVNANANANKDSDTCYISASATSLDPSRQTLQYLSTADIHSKSTRIRYRHSMLIATGSRGAPPPPSLFDKHANHRILELRNTQLHTQTHTHTNYVNHNGDGDDKNQQHQQQQQRPMLPPSTVRQITLMAASQGAKVCVMGSGLEAVELAAAAATTATASAANSTNSTADSKNVCLVFGSAGPLSTRLPRYLSSAVSKRLKSYGVDIRDRSLVRYVAFEDDALEVHMAKSYDFLDTARYKPDLLVVAPSVDGQRGTAVLPTPNLKISSSSYHYRPWSHLTPSDQSILSCYADDGRIVVNAELNAASNIYAAGSVAKYPNARTGHATVAGEGVLNAASAGNSAAHNMATDFYRSHTHNHPSSRHRHRHRHRRIFDVDSPLPIWRTDATADYNHTTHHLASIGIHALCVGQCDSETMATHGFWWTNHALHHRKQRAKKQPDHSIRSNRQRMQSNRTTSSSSNTLVRRRSTHSTSLTQKSVYGSGVIFYLDRSGSIRGIMLWGLPFTQSSSSSNTKMDHHVHPNSLHPINNVLLDRIKAIILSNGEVSKEDHRSALDPHLDPHLLSSTHLAEESKLLASLAISSSSNTHDKYQNPFPSAAENHKFPIVDISRPLHRFLPSKPVTTTSIGTLKRNDITGNGGIGEDTFATVTETNTKLRKEELVRPPSLVHVYPVDWSSSAFQYSSSTDSELDGHDYDTHDDQNSSLLENTLSHYAADKIRENDDNRARPPKEERLWTRKNESHKNISLNDVMADTFQYNMKRGRFQDGSDSVKQAPVPKVIQDVKEAYRDWSGSDERDEQE